MAGADLRHVTDEFAVAPQIQPHDVAGEAARGVSLIVNNRPDGEEPGQPPSAEIAGAAAEAGVAYLHLPFSGMPSPALVEEMRRAVDAADGKVLAFCRSGTRSIYTWALGQIGSGARSREEVLTLARTAGYDLAPFLSP